MTAFRVLVAAKVKAQLYELPGRELNKRIREAVMALPLSTTSRLP